MRKLTLVCLSLALVLMTGAAFAGDQNLPTGLEFRDGAYPGSLYGVPVNSAKADTFYIIGGPDRQDGRFQDDISGAIPDLEGWTSLDMNHKDDSQWHIDTFNAELLDTNFTPNHAMWCGEVFEECIVGLDNIGYGNDYREQIDFVATVNNPSIACEVNLTGVINYDTEQDWDFTYLQVSRATGMDVVAAFTGTNRDTNDVYQPVALDIDIPTVEPEDYVGASHDQVLLRWLVMSDGGTSNEDCWLFFYGACQVDNLEVTLSQVGETDIVLTENFEGPGPYKWNSTIAVDVGDFVKVWPKLDDIDVCNFNNSPQVAFIDDGVVVPGTGGTTGTTWTYGPGGYCVNLLGGLAGPLDHLNNQLWSPELEWPDGDYVGAELGWDVYRHLPLFNGLFYVWDIRTSDDDTATWDLWQSDGWVYYGGPDYIRSINDVTGAMLPGRTHVQIRISAYEIGWAWGFSETDATPSPYFDNISLRVYGYGGPSIVSRDIDVANDGFPIGAGVDFVNPGNLNNAVRFDMANNIAPATDLRNDPGDSIVAEIKLVRSLSTMPNLPRMYYTLKPNTLYGADASLGVRGTTPLTGYVEADSCRNPESGNVIPDRFFFDLPDGDGPEGLFLLPGDVLHYYIYAEDLVGGTPGISTLPGDLDGYGVFVGDAGYVPQQWSDEFTVRALPTVTGATDGDQVPMLFWNDFGDRGGENEWYAALGALGLQKGVDYDVFYTHGPSSGVSNGLGGRADYQDIKYYDDILYTAGNLDDYTISQVDYDSDAGGDVELLDLWLQDGKDLLITGDGVVRDMSNWANGVSFIDTWLDVDVNTENDVIPDIGNQTAPLVLPISGNTVGLTTEFIAYGGCPVINQFDEITLGTNAERIAEFADATGAGGIYSFSAGVLNQVSGSRVVYFPVDLMYWYTPDKADAPQNSRTSALEEILVFFGYTAGTGTGVTPANIPFMVNNYPNPFNPSTKIEYSVPMAGKVSIKIYNMKGQLVKTLVDESKTAGELYSATWNGTDNSNRSVASGVYFARTNVAGQYEKLNKLTLVK